MYSIELSQTSIKFLKKLNEKDSDIILNKIYFLRDNPFRFLKKLQGQKLWRLRIGDYRAVIDVIIKNNEIFVVKIGKRSNIYQTE